MPAQLGLVAPTKFTYFGLKTPVGFPCQILLECSDIEYEGVALDFAQWGELKAKTPNGQLPVAEFADGSTIAESGAIARTAAGAAGLLGEGADYSKSEWLAGMTVDFNKKYSALMPTSFTVDGFDAEKKEAARNGVEGLVEDLNKFAKLLLPSGDRFTEGGMTFGEVDLFAKLSCYATGALPMVVDLSLIHISEPTRPY
eukprot:TRINITY_DN6655_c0_g1_i2.p1 TRINITY_DN6655_c0_g1~~TRINITY_DN6655_c0_g1_i2.p1  ORF type:complete len:199 (-),score=53.62 TRINITY_DN6655_c0_g1_i2:79-675(-)